MVTLTMSSGGAVQALSGYWRSLASRAQVVQHQSKENDTIQPCGRFKVRPRGPSAWLRTRLPLTPSRSRDSLFVWRRGLSLLQIRHRQVGAASMDLDDAKRNFLWSKISSELV